jgi:S1-C subfamily serine protease
MLHRVIFMAALLMFVAACSPQKTVPFGSSLSTPVRDLPVSIDFENIAPILPTPVSDVIIQEADAEYLLLSNIYERTVPSVVNIEADLPSANADNVNRGSGFIYDNLGHIITNAHLVQNTVAIRVTFNDGFVTQADVIGFDTFSDLGLIRVNVDALRLNPLTMMPNSDAVRVGQRAIAIGNPFGLSSSMTVGIISGVGRTLRSAELIDSNAPIGFQNPSIIQTDAPINPGNSGGPLLNSQGQVMGVNTAIRTQSGVFQGVGFAVPANTVRRVVPELIARGFVEYAWMGISAHPEDNGFGVAGLAQALNLPVNKGILLRGITQGGPADIAGLRGGTSTRLIRGQSICVGGDIIVAINGVYVANMDELVSYLNVNTKAGDSVRLLVIRDRESFEVTLTLRARPASDTNVRDCAG